VPLALAADATAFGAGVEVSVVELSRAGVRLRIVGPARPMVTAGSRLAMRIVGRRKGARTPLSLTLEIRWVGSLRRARRGHAQEVGGRFVGLTPSLRRRLDAILRFEEARPRLSLGPIQPAEERPARSTARRSASRRAGARTTRRRR
jgi:hypothetical protein